MTGAAIEARSALAAWLGFAALCCGMFMAILDVQIVATALPTLETALHIAPENLSWIQTAYLMAEVVSIPLTGPLTRTLGLRRLVGVALVGFTLASVGCAASPDLVALVACRLVQGFAGGVLIPLVFSSVFLLFPRPQQAVATAVAGMVAVLAPTVGPLIGGYVTATWSWHWLFLINLPVGGLTTVAAILLLRREAPEGERLLGLDWPAFALMAASLATLVLGLKQAPEAGWLALSTLGLFAAALASGTAFVRRSLAGARPVVALRLLGRLRFATGCLLSFVFGMGLFGSVYLMPVFLGFVRGHDPLEIGRIMLVTGLAQFAAAPVAAMLESRFDARLLTAFGFLVFASGLALGATLTIATDFDAMVWPQILRGVGIMFCLVPTTRLAFEGLAKESVPDASGLFNLMRNLGGAIGLAVIDTILYGRAPRLGQALEAGLRAGHAQAAVQVGLSPALVAQQAGRALDADTAAYVTRLVGHAALTQASNEAWAMLAVLTVLAASALLWLRDPVS